MPWRFPKYPENWDEIRRAVYKRDNYTCTNCGATGTRMHCDHITPLSKGGTNDYSNLRTLCEECHIAEHPHLLNSPVFRDRHPELGEKGLTNIVAKEVLRWINR